MKAQMTQARQRLVSPLEAYRRFWTQGDLRGRASRSEFWWVILWNALLGFLMAKGSYLAATCETLFIFVNFAETVLFWLITWLGFALTVRRFHDIGKTAFLPILLTSASLALRFFTHLCKGNGALPLLPLIGVGMAIVCVLSLLVAINCALPSIPESNRYGDLPHRRN